MVTPSKYDFVSGAPSSHAKRKDMEVRRQKEARRAEKAVPGKCQDVEDIQLADVHELSAGLLKVPSFIIEGINDMRTKSKVALKSSGSSTPAKTCNVRDRGYGGGETTPYNISLKHQLQRCSEPLAENTGAATARRTSNRLDVATTTPSNRGGSTVATSVGIGLLPSRNSQPGESSPAVLALGGLRRARSTSSTAGGANGGEWCSRKELGQDESGGSAAFGDAETAAALIRASQALRSNWRSMQKPRGSDSGQEDSDEQHQEGQEDARRNGSGGQKPKRPVGAVLGVRQRVAIVAAAAAAATSTPSSRGDGANEGQAHKHLQSPRSSLAGAGRWEDWEAINSSGGGRHIRNTSEGSTRWQGGPAVRSVSRTGAGAVLLSSHAEGLRGKNGGRISSSSSSSSSDDDQRQLIDRGVSRTGPGKRMGMSGGSASGGGAFGVGAARTRSGSVGGGPLANGWFELASSNRAAAGCGVHSTGGGGHSTGRAPGVRSTGGGGRGFLHNYTYDSTSTSSSSESTSHDSGPKDAVQRRETASGCVRTRSSASPRGLHSSDGGSVLTAAATVSNATAPALQEAVGVRKLRGQLERARQSLLRLQLSSGGGGLSQQALAPRHSSGGGPSASQGGFGGGLGARPSRDGNDFSDRINDNGGSFQDDDIAMLLSALLEGQLSSPQEQYSIVAAATAAAASGGGGSRLPRDRVRFAADHPHKAVTSSPRNAVREADDDSEDEPWRIAARPLPPGKLVRLLRALQQLHMRHPELLQSRRHGRRLWRLLQGVATGDGEAEMLLDAVTGGRSAIGAGIAPRQALNDRSSGGGGAVAVLAAAMFGGGGQKKSSDGGNSGGGSGGYGRFQTRAATMAAPRQLLDEREAARAVKPSAVRSLAQWQESSLLAQEEKEKEAWKEIARTREIRGLDAAGKMRTYLGMDWTGYSPRSYGGAAAAAVTAITPTRTRSGGSTSSAWGHRSSSMPGSPGAPSAEVTSPRSRVTANARSPPPRSSCYSASPPSGRGPRPQSPSAAAGTPDDQQRPYPRLMPMAVSTSITRRSFPGSLNVNQFTTCVLRTSRDADSEMALGSARSISPSSMGGRSPRSPALINMFLSRKFMSAGGVSGGDTTAVATGPALLGPSQSLSTQAAAIWRNSFLVIGSPSGQSNRHALTLHEAMTSAGVESMSPSKALTQGASLRLLIPGMGSPRSPHSAGGVESAAGAGATMALELSHGSSRRSVRPSADLHETPGRGRMNMFLTSPQQSPPDAVVTRPKLATTVETRGTSVSPVEARPTTVPGSAAGQPRRLARTASNEGHRSPTFSTPGAAPRTPFPSGAGSTPSNAGFTSDPLAAFATTGADQVLRNKASPPRRWSPAGSAQHRAAKTATAGHQYSPSPASATSGDPSALTSAVQQLRDAVAARSRSLAQHLGTASPYLHARSRPTSTAASPSRHGTADSPGPSRSKTPNRSPEIRDDRVGHVSERLKAATLIVGGEGPRSPQRQREKPRHQSGQKWRLPPAKALQETTSSVGRSKSPSPGRSSPATATEASTPGSSHGMQSRQQTRFWDDGISYQASHSQPALLLTELDSSPSPSGTLPHTISEQYHDGAGGDGDREPHGRVGSSHSLASQMSREGILTHRQMQPMHNPQQQQSARYPEQQQHSGSFGASNSAFRAGVEAVSAVVTEGALQPAPDESGCDTLGRWVDGRAVWVDGMAPQSNTMATGWSSFAALNPGERQRAGHGGAGGEDYEGRFGRAGGGGGRDSGRGGGSGEGGRGGWGPSGRAGAGGSDGDGEEPYDDGDHGDDGEKEGVEYDDDDEEAAADEDNVSELSLRNKAAGVASAATKDSSMVANPKPAASNAPGRSTAAAVAPNRAVVFNSGSDYPTSTRWSPSDRRQALGRFPDESLNASHDGVITDGSDFARGAGRSCTEYGRGGASGSVGAGVQARTQAQSRGEVAGPRHVGHKHAQPSYSTTGRSVAATVTVNPVYMVPPEGGPSTSPPSSGLGSSPLPSDAVAAARAAADAAAAAYAARSKSPSPSPSPAAVTTAAAATPKATGGVPEFPTGAQSRLRSVSPSASASPSTRESDLAVRCFELEQQLSAVYSEMDELVFRTQGVKDIVSDSTGDLRQQLTAMEAALAALEAENRDLRAAVRHSRSTYDNAAVLAGKIARLQEKLEILTLDKHELQVQLDLARLSPCSTTPNLTAGTPTGTGTGTTPGSSSRKQARQQNDQQQLIEALTAQVAELKQEKAALQEHARQLAQLAAQQDSTATGKMGAALGVGMAAGVTARSESASTPRTVPRSAPPPAGTQPPLRSRSQSQSPSASPAAAPMASKAGQGPNRGDADGLMLARITQLQRQVRMLIAENDNLRCQSSLARAATAPCRQARQAQIRNLQGQGQALGQELESERWMRSHLNDMQVSAVSPTRRQSPLSGVQQSQQQPPSSRPVTASGPPLQQQRRRQQQRQPYAPLATAVVYGPMRPGPPARAPPVADFQVTVEPLAMRRSPTSTAGDVSNPGLMPERTGRG